MIVNNITISIEKDLEKEWYRWIMGEILPLVLNSVPVIGSSQLKLLNEVEGAGATYTFQFHFNNLSTYEQIPSPPAVIFYEEHSKKYSNRFVLFETLLEQL